MSQNGYTEIIRVRLSDTNYSATVIDIFNQLNSSIAADSEGSLLIALHVDLIDTKDYSIHLYSEKLERHISKTLLGCCIAQSLYPFGLVDHSLYKKTTP